MRQAQHDGTLRVAVLGASGYAGGELVRLLAAHSRAPRKVTRARASVGQTLAQAHPHLGSLPIAGEELREIDAAAIADVADLAFCSLPNGTSSAIAPRLLEAGVRVFDHAGDLRLPAAD